MAELEWIEERWWHRLLKVSGCLVALLSMVATGVVAFPLAHQARTYVSWEHRTPFHISIAVCVSRATGEISAQCENRISDPSLYGLASAFADAELITPEELQQVAAADDREAARLLELWSSSRRIGYWTTESWPIERLLLAAGATLAAPALLSALMYVLYLFLLFIAHGHTRVRPKA